MALELGWGLPGAGCSCRLAASHDSEAQIDSQTQGAFPGPRGRRPPIASSAWLGVARQGCRKLHGYWLRFHPANVEMLADQGRWSSPSLPREPQPPGAARPRSTSDAPVSPAAARVLLHLRSALLPLELQPTVDYTLAFLTADGTLSSSWFIALRHYSQLWCARARLAGTEGQSSGTVDCPVDVRKLLVVIDVELPRSTAGLSAPGHRALGKCRRCQASGESICSVWEARGVGCQGLSSRR